MVVMPSLSVFVFLLKLKCKVLFVCSSLASIGCFLSTKAKNISLYEVLVLFQREKGQEIFEQWLCSNKLMHLHAWTVPIDNKCILVSFVGVNLVIHVVSGATAPPK